MRRSTRNRSLILCAAGVLGALAMGATAARAEPASEFKAVPSPSGYVIVVHAGGWRIVGRGMLGFEYPNVGRLNGWGYSTLNVDYRAGADGLTDLLRFHDGLRRRIGKARLCVLGTSSGGHLALMLALRRPDVECAITEAAPTYLPGLTQPLLSAARRYFGPRGGLRTWSPALHPPRARLLLSHATNDPAVPFEQSARMLRAVPGAKRVALRPGKVGWVHTSVNAADLARLYRVERAFLDSGLAVSLALIPR